MLSLLVVVLGGCAMHNVHPNLKFVTLFVQYRLAMESGYIRYTGICSYRWGQKNRELLSTGTVTDCRYTYHGYRACTRNFTVKMIYLIIVSQVYPDADTTDSYPVRYCTVLMREYEQWYLKHPAGFWYQVSRSKVPVPNEYGTYFLSYEIEK
jgi:hypothetical protein